MRSQTGSVNYTKQESTPHAQPHDSVSHINTLDLQPLTVPGRPPTFTAQRLRLAREFSNAGDSLAVSN